MPATFLAVRAYQPTSPSAKPTSAVLPTIGPPPPYEEYCRVFIEEGVPVVETAG